MNFRYLFSQVLVDRQYRTAGTAGTILTLRCFPSTRCVRSVRYIHERRPSAGIIVIGNEVLKAQVGESNSFYARKLLYEHGVRVEKVSIVKDDVNDIADEVRNLSKKYDYVFTCGGIGPTHDDVTFEAMALAFEDTLSHRPTLVDIVKSKFSYTDPGSPGFKMARIPTKATLKFGINEDTGEKLVYPCIALGNVYVFPGSPMYFERSFQSLCKEFFPSNMPFATDEIYVKATEDSFADALTTVAKEYPNVSLGSYPERNRYYRVRITVESENETYTERARKRFYELVPAEILVHYDRAPHRNSLTKLQEFLLRMPGRRAIYEGTFEKMEAICRRAEQVFLYTDSSVESIVMLHLASAVAEKLKDARSRQKIRAVLVESNTVSASMSRFLWQLADRYNVELCVIPNAENVCRAIRNVSESKKRSVTLLLGKRSTEGQEALLQNFPYLSHEREAEGHLEILCPLIDWTDQDVEIFSTSLSLPYYSLEIENSGATGAENAWHAKKNKS